MTVYAVGSANFTSINKAIAHVRDLLRQHDHDCLLSSCDPGLFGVLMQVCSRHPDHLRKLDGVVDLKVDWTGGYALKLVRHDGVLDDISIKCCITGKPKSGKELVQRAVRNAVQPLIDATKAPWVGNTVACHLCRKPVYVFAAGAIQADHAGGMSFDSFSTRAIDYLARRGMPLPGVVADNSPGTLYTVKFADDDYITAIRQLHARHACILPACQACNIKAGRKPH
jgi:hypothetical protein